MLDCVDRACILFSDDDEVVQIDLRTLLGAMILVSRAASRRHLEVCWRHRAIVTWTTWAIALG